MDIIQVQMKDSFIHIENTPIKCPHCHVQIIPQYLYALNVEALDCHVFSQCTNPECKQTFISRFCLCRGERNLTFAGFEPNSKLDSIEFSPIIKTLSPAFYEIYNQAYKAQQLELTQICGPGYRKALEFLIKDYIMSKLDESQRDSIKRKLLAQCINDNIENPQIQEVAKRATWLGNDETHYLKEWLDKDISDLVQIIDLTISWIEYNVKTEKLLNDMPQRKNSR
jgi:hypothetical protein